MSRRQLQMFLAASAAALTLFAAQNAASQSGALPDDFVALLAKADAAQRELQNGRPEGYKALWSNADDVTLSGGFGGVIEKGWAAVGKRLEWAGAQFSDGTNQVERVVAHASADLGYVVQIERIRYRVPQTSTEATREYRVTMIFRREAGDWRIVHRHADSQVLKQGAP